MTPPREKHPPPPEWGPDEVKELLRTLKLSARDLALKLGVPLETMQMWQRGEGWPTLDSARKLQALSEGREPERRRRVAPDIYRDVLREPEFWALVRKLLYHPALLEAARKLAATYPDPAERKD